jgi:hypothetical protein
MTTHARTLICRVRGHRCRFGAFDRKALAHDLVCTRCGLVETAEQLAALIEGMEL